MRASLAILLLSSPALASPRLELGVALGGHAFSSDSELGVGDAMAEPGPASAALLGARVGLAFKGVARGAPRASTSLTISVRLRPRPGIRAAEPCRFA